MKMVEGGLALLGLGLMFVPLFGQANSTSKLTVRVTGVRNAKGDIQLELFRDAAGFPEASKAFRVQQAEIDPQSLSAEAVFDQIPPGTYAVYAFHDENMNGKLDKILGAPREGYGVSNDPQKRMGCSAHAYMPPYQCMKTPTFDEAQLSVGEPEHVVEIKMIY
jgi:uncharacterized protein (DUF2141 family)